MNEGESIRSEVSSRRRRSDEDVVDEAGVDALRTPDSWRTISSWSCGGRRYGSHLVDLQYD